MKKWFSLSRLIKELRINFQSGFTLTEVLIVMGIMGIAISMTIMNLQPASRRSAMNSTIGILVSDMRLQQMKAMVGDTEGRVDAEGKPLLDEYGIHFTTNSYILFHGIGYNPSDTANFTISLDDGITITSATTDLIFSRLSGEVMNYNSSNNTITLIDSSNNTQKVLRFNRYGVITETN